MCIIFLQRADTSVCKRRRDSDGSRDGQPFLRDKYYLPYFDFHGKTESVKTGGHYGQERLHTETDQQE